MRLYFDSHILVHGKDKVKFIKVFLIRGEADFFDSKNNFGDENFHHNEIQ